MKISIGSDHRGFALKKEIKLFFSNINWIDVGTDSAEKRVDYPLYAKKVCDDLLQKKACRGILICGSGVGVSIAANRNKHIYAALCWNQEVACAARNHDLANVLVLPADFVSEDKAIQIVKTWIDSEFLGGRYKERLNMIDALS